MMMYMVTSDIFEVLTQLYGYNDYDLQLY